MRFIDFLRNKIKREGSDASSSTKIIRSGGTGTVLYLPPDNALSVATVYRCVKVLSDAVAGLHVQHLRRNREGRMVDDEGSELSYLLNVEPQPERSASTFWATVVSLILLRGNAYIYPRRDYRGNITDLVLCRWESVTHDILNEKITINDGYNGVFGTFNESEIIHLFIHSCDGRIGESVISHARRTISIATVGDSETYTQFYEHGSVRGLVSNDRSALGFGEYQDNQLTSAAASIDERFKAGERIVGVPGEMDFKQISLSASDMQFLESRKFTVREICRFFGVHPSFVFDDSSNNYKSVEQANVSFLSMTLDPILKRFENELQRKIAGRMNYGREAFHFDRRGIFSFDLDSMANYQLKTIQSGIYTVNDWRRMENQPLVNGGDTPYLTTNLAPLGSEKLSGGAANNNSNDKEQDAETSGD